MAVHNFAPVRALQREVVELYLKCTGAGGTSNPTIDTGAGKGITSIAYNSATGKYRVTLDQKYAALMFVSGTIIEPSSVDDWEVVVEAETVSTTKRIDLAFFKGGTLAALTTGEKVLLEIVLKNVNA